MELRKKAGLSRTQVAAALGVSEGTVARWEQGKMEPHLPFWKTKIMLDLYQCTIEELAEAFMSDDGERIPDIGSFTSDRYIAAAS